MFNGSTFIDYFYVLWIKTSWFEQMSLKVAAETVGLAWIRLCLAVKKRLTKLAGAQVFFAYLWKQINK